MIRNKSRGTLISRMMISILLLETGNSRKALFFGDTLVCEHVVMLCSFSFYFVFYKSQGINGSRFCLKIERTTKSNTGYGD